MRRIFLAAILIITSLIVSCTAPVTVTQTATVTKSSIVTQPTTITQTSIGTVTATTTKTNIITLATTTTTTLPAVTTTIPTKTYRNSIFQWTVDYPATWSFTEFPTTEYPSPAAVVFQGNNMNATVSAGKGSTSINSIINIRSSFESLVVITQAGIYCTYTSILNGNKSYHWLQLFQEVGSPYFILIDFQCSLELYENNDMRLPKESQTILGFFSFRE